MRKEVVFQNGDNGNIIKTVPNEIEYIDMFEMLSVFTEKEIDYIFRQTGAIQLTLGCNSNCSPRCTKVPRGVKKAFSLDSLTEAVDKYGNSLAKNSFYPYWGSEPLDHPRFFDFMKMVKGKTGYTPFVSTTVPEGSWDMALELVNDGMLRRSEHWGDDGRISLPYFMRDKKKIYPNGMKERIDGFVKHVAHEKGITIKEARAMLPIEEMKHHIEPKGCWESLFIISPRKDENATGVNHYRGYGGNMNHLKREINKSNISEYMNSRYGYRCRMMT